MRLTLRQLQIFIAIAQSGSTTAAGERISLSQSAISAAIAELERTVNVQLFDRVGKRLQLNDHGRAMLPKAMVLINSAESLEQSYLDTPPSKLILGASLTIGNYLLPRLLADYWRSQGVILGNVAPPLQVVVAKMAEIEAKVAGFEVDIGLVEGPYHRPDIAVMPWHHDELLIVASPDHPVVQKYGQSIIPSKRLAATTWILRERGSGIRDTLEQALQPHTHQLKSSLEFNDHEAIKQSAIHGLGIACLSRLVVADALETGRLVRLNTSLRGINRRFSLVMHHQKQVTPGMQNFIDFVTREIALF